jgi:hypothetical protein
MKNAKRKNVLGLHALSMLLVAANLVMAAPDIVSAKSLYLIADIKNETTGVTQPLEVYDIGFDGALTFQAEHDIRHIMLGAVGIAIDSDSGYAFITYEGSGDILSLDTVVMKDATRITAPDAEDLAGIVYDHRKGLLYCVDRGRNSLYVYDWDPKARELSSVPGSPFNLWGANAFGIALDELTGRLYVANATTQVNVYKTSNWSLVDTISLGDIAISIAVDAANGFVYTGAGYAGERKLTQHHLATGKEARVELEPDAGVIGLAVDPDTGLVYMSTGLNNESGGDNLLVYDATLNLVDMIPIDGNPTGLAITVERPLELQSIRVIPDTIRRTTSSEDVQAIMVLPEGVGKDDVEDVLPVLHPGGVIAKRQTVFGTASRSKVIAVFDKAEIADAIPDYGQVAVKVIGQLKSGRSYAGETTVYMTRFTGN